MSSIGTKGGRWPRKPPPEARCDMSPGWQTGSLGEPQIIMCRQPAVETLKDRLGHEVWVCAEHADVAVETGQAFRNPKRQA